MRYSQIRLGFESFCWFGKENVQLPSNTKSSKKQLRTLALLPLPLLCEE
jgi:hypothetical protein